MDLIEKANKEAINRMINSHPVLVDIKPAFDAIPGMAEKLILHAGPPISYEKMCGPMKGAVTGAIVYEGWADNIEQADELAQSGEIKFAPCHHHDTVGPMAGVVSPSMWVFCIKNKTHGNMAYCTLNEGLGKVLRFGANSSEVIEKLKWMEHVLAPTLRKVVKAKEIDIKSIIAQALYMGDECHNRNVAGTSLFLREITPVLLEVEKDVKVVKEVFEFITANNHFFLNLSMPAAKATADTIKGIKNCSLMYAMARNGVEIGIRVAGTGDKWYVDKAGLPEGLYFPGYSEKDANPDLGDSTITETAGFGAMAMAASPAIVKFVGGTAQDAINFTMEMYEIAYGKHRDFQIASLSFMGTPLGVDIRKVVESGITPVINTGIAHKEPGIGQVGAGLLRAPVEIFKQALVDLHAIIEKESGHL